MLRPADIVTSRERVRLRYVTCRPSKLEIPQCDVTSEPDQPANRPADVSGPDSSFPKQYLICHRALASGAAVILWSVLQIVLYKGDELNLVLIPLAYPAITMSAVAYERFWCVKVFTGPPAPILLESLATQQLVTAHREGRVTCDVGHGAWDVGRVECLVPSRGCPFRL
jgi:hypothetical protein